MTRLAIRKGATELTTGMRVRPSVPTRFRLKRYSLVLRRSVYAPSAQLRDPRSLARELHHKGGPAAPAAAVTDTSDIRDRSQTMRRYAMITRRFRPLCSGALPVLVAVLVFAVSTPTSAASTAGPKAYYLALGDSLAYGYQPDGDVVQGYADDFFTDLQTHGTRSLTNLACPGETSGTFIHGGCPYWWTRKTLYTGSQLDAALAFISSHRGRVSPVTIDIGANDALAAFDPSTCTVGSNWPTVLSTFDRNFSFILGQLRSALKGQGDLVAMNYYDPYQNQCASNPQVLSLLQTFNQHIASDAAAYSVPVADVFASFGGATTPNPNICSYTWMCSVFNDIHATDPGYAVIASTFETTVGY